MKGDTMEWRDQVAVVTGGARGLGRATAQLLAQRGAAVCVNYATHAEAAQALVAEIATAGGRAIAVKADVADQAAVEAMVARAQAELGAVTILVNNAGSAWQGTLDSYDREKAARMRIGVLGKRAFHPGKAEGVRPAAVR
jgi:3-oxoacyl-[acyl-carrier protein] reductase